MTTQIHDNKINAPETVIQAVKDARPALPLYVISETHLAAQAEKFVQSFPGQVMFAVKANPDKDVIAALYRHGVHSFDVASLEEVKLARRYAPQAKLYFMHPVKSPEAIYAAYHGYGVRSFVIDTKEELYKIMRETGLAGDLEIFVRMALPKNNSAAIDFASKFGASPAETIELLKMARSVASRLGVSFHVGTQTMDPSVYGKAIDIAAQVIRESGVKVDALDIGGGFPADYPDMTPPPFEDYMSSIRAGIARNNLKNMELLAEPGRCLVACGGWLAVRVEQRRGDLLYLNDGTYGGLFDAGPLLKGRFPVSHIAADDHPHDAGEEEPFRFSGPTCDSLDMMDGPFMLPSSIKTGDWIVIGNMGAYSLALRGNFNGFGKADVMCLRKEKARRSSSAKS